MLIKLCVGMGVEREVSLYNIAVTLLHFYIICFNELKLLKNLCVNLGKVFERKQRERVY